MCPSPHQKKSNSQVPEHGLYAPLWFLCLSSLLLHSLTFVLCQHLNLPLHCSLCICSAMFALEHSYWGLGVQTAAPLRGFVFEKSQAERMVLWTQQQPLRAVCDQMRGAGPGLHWRPLRFQICDKWGQGFEIWSLNGWEGPVHQWVRSCNNLSNYWLNYSHLHSTCLHVRNCTVTFYLYDRDNIMSQACQLLVS